jgi:DNA (cytosine-5)-methyltransferase 1
MNVLALCAGIGGIELGLKLAEPGARTVCYVEREAFPIAVTLTRIREGYLDDAPIWSDVKTFDGRPWRGVVDCIAGGYPCQPFSVAGHQQGEDDPRHLWPDIRRIISEIQPRFCFFENVAGHLQLGFESVWGNLRDMGYQVEAGLFTAAEVGAPHKRQRLFILADANRRQPSRRRGESSRPNIARPYGQPTGQGGILGDSDKPGPQGWRESKREGQHELPAWPPGPEDTDAWAAVLEREPGLEPALRRVVDGVPHRVDRLAALGNAVVPAVAAKAWRQLRKEADGFKVK